MGSGYVGKIDCLNSNHPADKWTKDARACAMTVVAETRVCIRPDSDLAAVILGTTYANITGQGH